MIEKKLTDEEIVKAYEHCYVNDGHCKSCCLSDEDKLCVSHEDVLDLINRQKAEIERLNLAIEGFTSENKVLNNENDKLINDNELKAAQVGLLTEQVEYLKMCADNFLADYQNAQEELAPAKQELVNEQRYYENAYSKACQLETQNAELQKQVEELKEERENMQAVIFALEEEKRELNKQVDELKECLQLANKSIEVNNRRAEENHEQAVKERTKACLDDIVDCIESMLDGERYMTKNEVEYLLEHILNKKQEYGVEVE